MDIGSSKITVMVGSRGVNNTVNVRGIGECEYAGYEDGEWFRPDELINAVGRAISLAQSDAHIKIRHIYVGVPGQFTVTQCKEVATSLSRKRRVTEADIDELFAQGDTFSNNPEYTLINSQPIFYTLGDDRKLIQPVGMTASRISGFISYILAEKSFTDKFDHMLDELGIESHEYVSAVLAESLYLFDDFVRDRYVVLIDVGYIVTDVAVARGDGVLRQFSMPFGGGHITKELRDAFGIRFPLAEKLKRKVVLNLEFADSDTYDIMAKDRAMSYSAKLVNDIVKFKLDKLSRTIGSCLMSCDLPPSASFYLTGGGISYMNGARDYLSKKLDRHIEIAKPSQPQYNKPHLSTTLGLMDMVLGADSAPSDKKGFFARLFGR